jgi:hypothetical protein
MTSWKAYGGLYNFSRDHSITTNSLVTNSFTLKNSYVGNFTVTGVLTSEDDLVTQSNTYTSGNVAANGYIRANSTLYLGEAGATPTYSANPYITGNAAAQSLLLGSNAAVSSTSQFVTIGINATESGTTLNVKGNTATTLAVSTTATTNTNILAKNAAGDNITLGVTTSTETATFTSVSSASFATITHDASAATLEFDIAGNVKMNAPVHFSADATAREPSISVSSATVSVFDVANGNYLDDSYATDSLIPYGTGLRVIGAEAGNAVTFVDLVTPSNRGLGIGGGMYPGNVSQTMGTLGLYNASGTFVPAHTMVSGTSSVRLRATTGINTYLPRTDEYAMAINGPTIVASAQITAAYSITSANATTLNAVPVAAVGNNVVAGYTVPRTAGGSDVYLLNSVDGGETWSANVVTAASTTTKPTGAFVSDTGTSAVICGTGNAFFVTTDAMSSSPSWSQLVFDYGTVSTYFTDASLMAAVGVFDLYTANATTQSVCVIASPPGIAYFVMTGQVATGLARITANGSQSNYSDYYNGGAGTISALNQVAKAAIINTSSANIGNVVAISNATFEISNTKYLFCTGKTGVARLTLPSVAATLAAATITVNTSYVYTGTVEYKAAATSGNVTMCVGTDSVWRTTDGGATYNTATLAADGTAFGNLVSISVYASGVRAVAITKEFKVFYTRDTGATWVSVTDTELNRGGDVPRLRDTLEAISSAIVVESKNTVVFGASTIANTSTYGATVYNGYLPDVVNPHNHAVLDVYGNSAVYGVMNVSGNTNVTGNVNVASNVAITQNLAVTGNAAVTGNVAVASNVAITQNLAVTGNAAITTNLAVTGTTTFTGNVAASANLTVAGKATITGNLTTLGNLIVTGQVTSAGSSVGGDFAVSANLAVGNGVDSTTTATGAVKVTGGVGVTANIQIGNTAVISGTTIATYSASTTLSGALRVSGGASLAGNLIVGNVSVNQTSGSVTTGALVVNGGAGIKENVYVGGLVNVAGAVTGLSFSATSDARFKTNVADLQYGAAEIMRMRPVSYTFNFGEDRATHLGLIAQELREIVPETVTKVGSGADARLAISYSDLIPIIIKTVQDQQSQIELLSDRIAVLETRL